MVSSHSPLCEPCCSSTLELESCQLPRHGAKHIVGLQACLPCTCLLLTDFKALSPNYPHGHLTQQKYSCDRDRRAPCWSGGYGGGGVDLPTIQTRHLISKLSCTSPDHSYLLSQTSVILAAHLPGLEQQDGMPPNPSRRRLQDLRVGR